MTKETSTRTHRYLLVFLAIFVVCASVNSKAGYELLEVTHSTDNKTFDQINTISFYASMSKRHGETSYGGIQLASYNYTNNLETDSIVRILFGQSIEGLISPFFEIGTDLLGLFALTSNNDNNQNCKNTKNCSVDAFFRVGIRVRINKTNTLGIFHENIDFGDFHSNLVGEHSYTGASLGFNF